MPVLTDDYLSELVAVWEGNDRNYSKTARDLEMPRTTIYSQLAIAASRGIHSLVPDVLPPGQMLRGVSIYYDKEGKPSQRWVKTKDDGHDRFVDAIKTAFEEYTGPTSPTPAPVVAAENLLNVIPVVDHHLGLFSWAAETREDNYDLGIATELLRSTAVQLMQRMPAAEECVILGLGDFFHADTEENRTRASGNALDVDGRYAKIMMAGVMLVVDLITHALLKHRRVRVRLLKGNHDEHAATALAVALMAWFRNEDRVALDLDPSLFWIHQWGKTMLGATHGHKAKDADLASVMATTEKEMWGATDYKYGYMGHLHHRKPAREVGGVMVETLQTLAPKDAWAASMGFTSNRSMTGITIDKDEGEIHRETINIPRRKFVELEAEQNAKK